MIISLSQWLDSLKRHWFIAGFSFCCIGVLTVYVIVFGTREYRSVSRLLLRIGHENGTLDPVTTATGERIAPIHTREDEVETAIGVMQSRAIMEEVVAKVGAGLILRGGKPETVGSPTEQNSPPSKRGNILSELKSQLGSIDPISENEAAVRALEKGFSISAPSKSSLVTVEYKAKTPALAQEVVQTWVTTYLQHNAKVHRTAGTYTFLSEQDAVLRKQLQNVHSEIKAAKSNGGFVTLEGQQKILESQLQNVRNEQQRVAAELVEAETRVSSYEELLNKSVDKFTTEEVSGIASEARNQMRGVLFQLEILEKEYAAKYKEDHPKLKAIREQLQSAAKIVNDQAAERKQFKQSESPIHQRIRENQVVDMALRDALSGKLVKLAEQQNVVLADINALNNEEEKLVGLLREAAVLEERNKLHSVLLERARLNEVLDENQITSINVVQPASYEARPVTPNKRMCAMVGLFAAILVSVTLPVLLDSKQILAAAATDLQHEPAHPSDSAESAANPLPGNGSADDQSNKAASTHCEAEKGAVSSSSTTSASAQLRVTPSTIDQPPTLPR